MSFLGRIFPNPHVRDALVYLDSLDAIMEGDTGSAWWPAAKRRVRDSIAANGRSIRSAVVVDGLLVRQIVLNIVMSQMADDLAMGGDHVHRGLLGMRGKSKSVIFGKALGELVRGGFLTEDEATEARAALRADIAGAG